MDDPVLVPLGEKVSATTLASRRALSGPVERTSYSIRYTPELLENIRLLCMSSFVADGAGVPIVGLLYGTRTGDEICVTAWTPAGELRNHNDAEFALRLQMRMATARPETAGLECLGWIRTRNHGEPRMVEEDRSLFERCFPGAWQTTMVVRPSYQKPTKAAFYLRDAGSAVRLDRPAQVFFLYPADEASPASNPGAEATPVAAPVANIVPNAAVPDTADLELLPTGTVRAFSPWIAAMLVLVGLLAGSGMAALRGAKSADTPVVATAASQPLSVQHQAGHWTVRWDKSLAELPGASGASLTVTRDGHTKLTALPLDDFRNGSKRIDWVSDDMEVTLRVDRPGFPEVEQRVRVVGMNKPAKRAQPRTNL